MGYDFGTPRRSYPQRPDARTTHDSRAPYTSVSYPRIAQPVGPSRPPPPVPVQSPSSGTGIRVALKPEYQVAPPPLLLPLNGDVPHSTFQFNFDLERKILAEAEKGAKAWNRSTPTAGHPSKGKESNLVQDPILNKYTAMGLNKEAVVLALAAFGDVQNKVVDFVTSYNLLREMGFPSDDIAGALAMYDNDKERTLQHFVKGL